MWDATAALEALGAADVALWFWDPLTDNLHFTGAVRPLALSPLAPTCPSAAILALAMPQDRSLVEQILKVQPPGEEIVARIRMRGGETGIWRGVWLEDGIRAAGVIVPEVKFAASERDALTGLLDRRSFIARARERLQTAGGQTLVVADLDRLRRH